MWISTLTGQLRNIYSAFFKYLRQNVNTIAVFSYSDAGLSSIKFSRERTLKRMVVIFAATSQQFSKSVTARTIRFIEKSFYSFPM